MRIQSFVAAVSLIPFVAGCSLYLHSPSLQKNADAARTDFQAILKNAPAQVVIAAHAAQVDLTATVTRDITRLDSLVQTDALLSQTWAQLIDETQGELVRAAQALGSARSNRARIADRIKADLAALTDSKSQVQTHLDALNEASRQAAQYVATQGLLRESLVALTNPTSSKSLPAIRKVLETRYTYAEYSETPAGALTSKDVTVTGETLLGIPVKDLPTDLKSLEDVEGIGSLVKRVPNISDVALKRLTFRNPGIATTIVGLGLDVARAREQRLNTAVDSGRAMLKVHDAQIEYLDGYVKRLRADLNPSGAGIVAGAEVEALALKEAAKTDPPALRQGQPVRATLEYLTQSQRNPHLLSLAYQGLASNLKLRTVDAREAEVFTAKIDGLRTQETLKTAASDLAEREAVMGRGLEGLVAFHAGGLTSEDLGRIIGIAQTIGIFVIAGGQ